MSFYLKVVSFVFLETRLRNERTRLRFVLKL